MAKMIFFDTEFTDFKEMGLISVGFSVGDGDGLYFGLRNGWNLDDCSAFVIETVLPLVQHRNPVFATRKDAAIAILDWAVSSSAGDDVLFVCDYDGDAYLLAGLLMESGRWPSDGLPKIIHVKSVLYDPLEFDFLNETLEALLESIDDRHNAMADADCLRKAWVLLDGQRIK